MHHEEEEIKKLTWSSPPENCYKLNVEVALIKDLKSFGIGVIIRDLASEVLLAGDLN